MNAEAEFTLWLEGRMGRKFKDWELKELRQWLRRIWLELNA